MLFKIGLSHHYVAQVTTQIHSTSSTSAFQTFITPMSHHSHPVHTSRSTPCVWHRGLNLTLHMIGTHTTTQLHPQAALRFHLKTGSGWVVPALNFLCLPGRPWSSWLSHVHAFSCLITNPLHRPYNGKEMHAARNEASLCDLTSAERSRLPSSKQTQEFKLHACQLLVLFRLALWWRPSEASLAGSFVYLLWEAKNVWHTINVSWIRKWA